MFIPQLFILVLITASAPFCDEAQEVCVSYEVAQGVVVRNNSHLRCNQIGAELYLYTNGSFKIISGDEALCGNYTIEDGENLVLNANGFRSTYGKIYFKGAVVSKVVLGDRTYYPV